MEQSYKVANGVNWINGKKVGDERTVSQTPQAALYDLALGRLTPVDPAPAAPQVVTPPGSKVKNQPGADSTAADSAGDALPDSQNGGN